MKRRGKTFLRLCSYLLVAALASAATWCFVPGSNKLDQLAAIIEHRFIGEADMILVEDAAATAMVAALGDRWSHYIPAAEYADYVHNQKNEYVGIGVAIQKRQDDTGFDVVEVNKGGPAEKAGILPGDIITHVDEESVMELDSTGLSSLILGEENTKVSVTVLRSKETLHFTVTRKPIYSSSVAGVMLTQTTGYVRIANFYTGTAKEAIKVIEELMSQGAESLVLDVRNNPGGYTDEMVELLDYLLPEGPLFKTVNYNGTEELETSDVACLEIPMAVLMNGNSYSAAEFFAAALDEYDWAVTVGEQTVGKGYYQITTPLSDGSAVSLSMGKYFTPRGINLAEAGGLVPDIPVEPAQGYVSLEEDPQIHAALGAITGNS